MPSPPKSARIGDSGRLSDGGCPSQPGHVIGPAAPLEAEFVNHGTGRLEMIWKMDGAPVAGVRGSGFRLG
jgi:hypothetical protein